ncbi:cyclic nucleotide-binding domain-containing protein [candidate division KSB1 bacterium]
MEKIAEMLKKNFLLKGLDDKYLSKMAKFAVKEHFESGKIIFRMSDEVHKVYIIESGAVSLESSLSTRKEPITIQIIRKGESFGWSWFLYSNTSLFDARTIEHTEVIAFDSNNLRKLCENDHDLGYELLKRITRILTQRLSMTRVRLVDACSQYVTHNNSVQKI